MYNECKWSASTKDKKEDKAACIQKSYGNASCLKFKSAETCLADFCYWDYFTNTCRKPGTTDRKCENKNYTECLDNKKCMWVPSDGVLAIEKCTPDQCALLSKSRCRKAWSVCSWNATSRTCRNLCAGNDINICSKNPQCVWVQPYDDIQGLCRRGLCSSLAQTNSSLCQSSPLNCVWDPDLRKCSTDVCVIASTEEVCNSLSIGNRQCKWSSTTKCRDVCLKASTQEECLIASKTGQCYWNETTRFCSFVSGYKLCSNKTSSVSCSATTICKWTADGCIYNALCSPLQEKASCNREAECAWDSTKQLCVSTCGSIRDISSCTATGTCLWVEPFDPFKTVMIILCCVAGVLVLGIAATTIACTHYKCKKIKAPFLGYMLLHTSKGNTVDLFGENVPQTETTTDSNNILTSS
ncbi:hypothetical protein Pelo_5740 [Pelomyxa schiedti]|nr:hypothetical protein Pelo_5740 [Pelomyxa schiedti]